MMKFLPFIKAKSTISTTTNLDAGGGEVQQQRETSARTVQAGWRGHSARTRDPEVQSFQRTQLFSFSFWLSSVYQIDIVN